MNEKTSGLSFITHHSAFIIFLRLAYVDVLVEPAGGVGERADALLLALPDALHRDEQEDKAGEPEEDSAEAAAGDPMECREEPADHEDRQVQRQRLRRMKAHTRFLSRHRQQLDERKYETDVERRVRQHDRPLLSDVKAG